MLIPQKLEQVNGDLMLVGNSVTVSPVDRILESGIVRIGSTHVGTDWIVFESGKFSTESLIQTLRSRPTYSSITTCIIHGLL